MHCACCILSSVVCPALQSFSTLSHKRYDFRNNVIGHKMCVLIFSTTFVWNISHSKKNWARYDQKCISVFMYSTGYSCQISIKLEFPRQIFVKSSNIKFHENPYKRSSVLPYGRTHMTKLTVAFSQFTNAPIQAKQKIKVFPKLTFIALVIIFSPCSCLCQQRGCPEAWLHFARSQQHLKLGLDFFLLHPSWFSSRWSTWVAETSLSKK